MENRNLLSSTGFLQGIAFVDHNTNNIFDAGDSVEVGTTIQLYQGGTLLATKLTDSNGIYRFSGLAPGQYQLVENLASLPQYQPAGVQILSQINPASAVNSSTINVTVVDPSNLIVTANLTKFFAANNWAYLQYTLYGTDVHQDYFGQIPTQFTDGAYSSASFLSYCYDPFHSLAPPSSQFYATLNSDPGQTNPNFSSGGEIAYLYNHYAVDPVTGVSIVLSQMKAVALQMAMREVEFDPQSVPYTAADFSSGNFAIDELLSPNPAGTPPLSTFVSQAVIYANEAIGKNETALFLDPGTVIARGSQGLLATESYNFANSSTAFDLAISKTDGVPTYTP
ncbi:MAG: SdrD B-like domain-containing protein, partial [Planctomycetota bacterium]